MYDLIKDIFYSKANIRFALNINPTNFIMQNIKKF